MFRILSLDGGGIKGAFTASVLAEYEKVSGEPLYRSFDLITGTSTGGILALALGMSIPAEDIVRFYREHGPDIFPSMSTFARLGSAFRWFFAPKHSHKVLREKLTQVLGDRRFGEAKTRLLIPTYDAVGGRIFLLKTGHHPRFRYDVNALAVDVALATSAAPTYFAAAPFPEHEGASFVDGGVWANSPVMAGLVESLAFLNVQIQDVAMLSIGTTSTPFSIADQANAGVAQWNAGLINLVMEAQSQAALAQVGLLLGDRFHRVNVVAETGRYGLDTATPKKIDEMIQLGRGEAVKKANFERVQQLFLTGVPAPEFKPDVTLSDKARDA
jgi:patatin-like phospholipase/acyl hydrolase